MLTRLAVWLSISAVALLSADSERVTIQLSEEIAPPGGSVQIKATLRIPKRVANGRLVLRLDPAGFEAIGYAAVFSARRIGTFDSARHANS